MDIEKAKRLLAKINVLVENVDESFSTLEHDLLKTYIKDLYENVSGIETVTEKPDPPQPKTQRPEVEVPPEDAQSVTPEKEIHASSGEEVPSQIPTAVPAQKEEREAVLGIVVPEDNPGLTETPAEDSEWQEKEPGHIVENPVHAATNPELEALFELPKGEDLASRLSAKPIRLVEDAMGINDRISTINELFGKDHDLFQETLKRVNGFESYDQAREFLITGVAQSNQWSSEEKAEKALEFIRLIGRKFQSN